MLSIKPTAYADDRFHYSFHTEW